MNIAFVTPQLKIGGYEKVVINYANAFCTMGHKITIICGFKEGEYEKQLNPQIAVVEFKARLRTFLIPLIKYLKNNKVDILYVPFHTYTSVAVIAKMIARSKVIIYSAEHGFENESQKFIRKTMKYFIKKADVLIAVSETVAKYDAEQFGIDRNRYHIFDNPVYNSEEHSDGIKCVWLDEQKCPVLVTSGRLAKDKHIDIPIKIVAEVSKKRNVSLLILGNGTEKEHLLDLVEELQISDIVHFEGFVSNPIRYISKCDIYLQTSEIESFGNGVVEAQYCNIPAIVTDCGGPVELIENGKYGVNIGSFNSKEVILNGVQAVLNILDENIIFHGLQERTQKYDALNLEKQFMEPYYECTKKS